MNNYKFTPISVRPQRLRHALRHQRGMTLVEWMVSITIGMILLAGLTALIARQSSTQAELEKSSRQIENGRYAMQLLNEDIQMAGYYGEFSDVGSLAVPGTLPDPCLTGVADLEAAMAFPVQGYDALTTGLSSCIAASNHVDGTDILLVRRASSANADTLTTAQAASAAASAVYLQAGLTTSGNVFEKKLATGATTSAFTLLTQAKAAIPATPTASATAAIPAGPAPLRKFIVHIYFVSPCNVMTGSTCTSSDDGGKPIPTLKRLELSTSGALTTTPLAEGIENLQIDYGIDTSGDGAADSDFVATTTDWSNVVSVRVHVLARSNETSAGYIDAKTYTMGVIDSTGTAQTVTPGGAYKRHLFSQQIRLINPSSRRDQ